MARFLIVAACFYREITDELISNCTKSLDALGHSFEITEVPGSFEIPAVIHWAESSQKNYDGYIALGCVIRGETTHYDHICQEVNRALMDLTVRGLVVVNGVLTVENEEQAWARANAKEKNRGGEFAHVAHEMVKIRQGLNPKRNLKAAS